MDKYINATAMIKVLDGVIKDDSYELIVKDECDFCKELLERIPGVDVAPVRHAHWEYLGDSASERCTVYRCSECKDTVKIPFHAGRLKPFCGECGAMMYGEVNDEND